MFKRHDEQGSLEEEREALSQQRAALDELKRQLSERVAAVRERERELQQVIEEARRGDLPEVARAPDASLAARAAELDRRERLLAQRAAAEAGGADPTGDGRARELERRVAEIEAREAAAIAREGELASLAAALEARETTIQVPAEPPGEEQAARIDARIAELQAAEALFMRTRDELAARSEAVAARERLATQRERELDERDDMDGLPRPQLGDLEARLKRLEQQQEHPGEQTQGFSSGLRKLQREGTRPHD